MKWKRAPGYPVGLEKLQQLRGILKREKVARLLGLRHQTVDQREGTGTFAKDCCDREVIAWRAWEGKGLPGEPVREMLIEAVERCFGTVETIP